MASDAWRAGARLHPWSLVYNHYDPEREGEREALCTLGNGRFATRGAASDALGASRAHYPGCYAAGIYDQLTDEIQGKYVEYEELVNLPNWLPLRCSAEGGDAFSLEHAELLEFRQELDLAHGVLLRDLRLCDARGRRVRVREQRLVHASLTHVAALHVAFEPENWSGMLRVESWIDGAVQNTNAEEYQGLDRRHLAGVERHASSGSIALRVRTRQSRVEIAVAARTRVSRSAEPEVLEERERIGARYTLRVAPGAVIAVEKVVALYTSRDAACSEPLSAALRTLDDAPSFEALRESHAAAWAAHWQRFAIELPGLDSTTCAVRLHAFHLLQTIAPASEAEAIDAGVPARGLHGENYHGHVFWDELFVFRCLNLRHSELTRSLLLYRQRRLPEARRAAREAGLRGALFPWRSASDGRDVTERWRRNPRTGRFIPDHSYLQRHINAAIVYNVWAYFEATHDRDFLTQYAAEIVLSIALFWSSAARYDERDQRYHILGVIGPDEFHDAYPGAERPGIDDNAYTNVMAVWCLLRARDVLAILSPLDSARLRESLGIDDTELDRWSDISRKMALHFTQEGVIAQFRGFDQLEPFPWAEYRSRHEDIHRLDNLLDAEGDSPNRYQVCKQADALMLFYLFSPEQVRELFVRLGYGFDAGAYERTVQYYMHRTSHGSTLSRIVYACVLTRMDRECSYRVLREALGGDIADVGHRSPREGVHMGAMAGTIDIFQRAYLGLEQTHDALVLDPQLPPEVPRLRLRLCYLTQLIDIDVDHEYVRVTTHANGPVVVLRIAGSDCTLAPGTECSVRLYSPAS